MQQVLDPKALADLPFEELKALQEQAAEAVKLRQKAARGDALHRILELVQTFGITPDELRSLSAKAKAATSTTRKAAPKYRDPVSGASWSGRGVAPLWIKDTPKGDRDRLFGIAPTAPVSPAPAPVVETPTEDIPASMEAALQEAGLASIPEVEDEPTPEQLGEADEDEPASTLFQTVIGGEDDGDDPMQPLAASSLFRS